MNSTHYPNPNLNNCSDICALSLSEAEESSLSGCVRLSPFSRYANATLYLQVAKETRVDEETGNLVPIMENLKLRALLKQSDKKDDKEQLMPALDQTETYLEGWLVDPMDFPSGITTPIECIADVDDRRGRLRIPLLIHNPYKTEKITGRKLKAFFKVVG